MRLDIPGLSDKLEADELATAVWDGGMLAIEDDRVALGGLHRLLGTSFSFTFVASRSILISVLTSSIK